MRRSHVNGVAQNALKGWMGKVINAPNLSWCSVEDTFDVALESSLSYSLRSSSKNQSPRLRANLLKMNRIWEKMVVAQNRDECLTLTNWSLSLDAGDGYFLQTVALPDEKQSEVLTFHARLMKEEREDARAEGMTTIRDRLFLPWLRIELSGFSRLLPPENATWTFPD